MPARAASANLVVINGSPRHPSLAALPRPKDLAPVQMTLVPGRVLSLGAGRADRTLESFRGQRVHAVAGIGNPARFFEDLRFKDFEGAARYHRPEMRATVNIPYLLERLFVQKPETLDITSAEVLQVEIDSTGNRARVRSVLRARNLLNEKSAEREMMLFFTRDIAGEPWYMELESSLRRLEGKEKR